MGEKLSEDDLVTLICAIGATVHGLKRFYSDSEEIDHGASMVLGVLFRRGPSRPSEIAQHTNLDLSTVSRHARFQEDAGRLVKVADPADRRAHRLALTDEGVDHVAEMWRRRIERLAVAVGHWSAEDARTLSQLAERLAGDLGMNTPIEMPDPEAVRALHRAAIAETHPKGA
ncbi:winged helix-turn-helix transcriptional regulator [Actinospica sp. MGRD01-02]|uniref:Winged helix-turn-helix transcriptional regulator n=1 Tax=Actinospica acidithermotolerans TaxID=2828514 RepID=A0A941IJN2_9ACTN|nr:MarR family winged helix-turn-helix transcriptional regulator [Actinospica acidithermotolerans]MBR7828057.1 winged helix-turn-helix transcriptional regulator [Actinospica acidithermotolerans]